MRVGTLGEVLVKVSPSKPFPKFGNLRAQLRQGEAKEFGPKPAPEIVRDRESLIHAISGNRGSNLHVGQLAAIYRDRFKVDHTWMPLGRAIARALGYRSYTSLDSLMTAAKNAGRIPVLLRDAVIEAGIDPTERKYASLVNELAMTDFTGTRKEAQDVVLTAIQSFKEHKKTEAKKRRLERSVSNAETGEGVAKQIVSCLKKTPPDERRQQAQMFVGQLSEAVRKEFPEFILSLAWVESRAAAETCGDQTTISATPSAIALEKIQSIRNSTIGEPDRFEANATRAADSREDEAKAENTSAHSGSKKPQKAPHDNGTGFLFAQPGSCPTLEDQPQSSSERTTDKSAA